MANYISSSTVTATSTAANAVAAALDTDIYELQSVDNAFWYSTRGTAAAEGANSQYVPAGSWVEVRVGSGGGNISVIRAGSTDAKVVVSLVSP